MRTIDEILKEMIDEKNRQEALRGLTSTSKTAVWRLLLYVVAFAVWTLERLFGEHEKEVKEYIAEMKPHTLRWYANMAKAFRLGDVLNDDGVYDQELSDEDLESVCIVKHASCREITDTAGAAPVLYLKVAKGYGDGRSPLSAIGEENELTAFKAYVGRMKDAGINLQIINEEACGIDIKATVYYNPMSLTSDGTNVQNPELRVVEAIKDYVENIPFDSEFRKNELEDAIRSVEGVVMVEIESIAFDEDNKHVDNDTTAYYHPYSGYFRLGDDTDITYEIYESARN